MVVRVEATVVPVLDTPAALEPEGEAEGTLGTDEAPAALEADEGDSEETMAKAEVEDGLGVETGTGTMVSVIGVTVEEPPREKDGETEELEGEATGVDEDDEELTRAKAELELGMGMALETWPMVMVVLRPGQSVTVGAHEMTVISSVVKKVEVTSTKGELVELAEGVMTAAAELLLGLTVLLDEGMLTSAAKAGATAATAARTARYCIVDGCLKFVSEVKDYGRLPE